MSFKAKNLSQAIEELERISENASDFLKPHLEDLKGHVGDIKGQVEDGAKKAKHKVEEKVQKNPWAAIGIVGLIFFVLGFLFATRRSGRSD